MLSGDNTSLAKSKETRQNSMDQDFSIHICLLDTRQLQPSIAHLKISYEFKCYEIVIYFVGILWFLNPLHVNIFRGKTLRMQ
jgi:hypothetical protein